MLLELSVIPLGRGRSISADIVDLVKIIDASGLDYRLTAAGTIIEGRWDQLMDVARKCHTEMPQKTERVITSVKVDDYADRAGRLTGAIASIEGKFQTVIVQLLLRNAFARQPELEDGDRRGAVGDDQWRRSADKQPPELRLGICSDLGNGLVDTHRGLKENFRYGDAIERLRLNVRDVIHRSGQSALGDRDDPVRDILRGKSVIVPDNADDENVNIRKDVRGSTNNRETPKDKNQNNKYHKRVWPLQR